MDTCGFVARPLGAGNAAGGYNAPMMPPDSQDGAVRAEREPPDLLRGQMRQWMEQVVAAGKVGELFELEMWLRSFERFFRIKNQPLSEKETRQLALRNWSEELRLVDNVVLRVVHLCTCILSEDQVNLSRFDRYIESYLRKDDVVDPYIEKLVRQTTAEAGLTLLREGFEDIHVVLTDLTRLARIPYVSFVSLGKLLYREVRRSDLLALLIDKKFKPVHDRITNHTIAVTIRRIEEPRLRKHAAKVFLEFFRLLHYLEYADPQRLDEENLKSTILIFSLITSETRLLLSYIERRVLKALEPESSVFQCYDSFVYCVPLELKKVINTELLDISVSRQSDNVRARVENSHGILRDCFQQSVVQLAQAFDAVDGRDIFADFTAKLDQSVHLRDGLAHLILSVREFQTRRDESTALHMKEDISKFYDTSMKYLMYRDWSGFELFFIEILKCSSLPALHQIGHRFETFLMTLFREVQKRGILQDLPLPEHLRGVVEARV
jgi:hypothetical protein